MRLCLVFLLLAFPAAARAASLPPRLFPQPPFPLVRTQARFLKPTRFGDDVTVDTSIKFGRTSFEIEHRLSLNGETCAECSETRVWTVRDAGGAMKSHPIPEDVRSKFAT